MTSRNLLVREMFLLAFGIGVVIVVVLGVGLAVSGILTPLWLAHSILVTALLIGGLELLMVPRALRVNHVHGPLNTWRVTDRAQGCGILLLGALVTAGLLICGGLLELVLDWK